MSYTNSTTARPPEPATSDAVPAIAEAARISPTRSSLDSNGPAQSPLPLDAINPEERGLPLDSCDPADNRFALDADGPDVTSRTASPEQRIALDLLVRMNGDYPATAVLLALLWRSADRMAVRISSRALAACCGLGHQVVQRALQRLECRALIAGKKLPRATAAYRVNVQALRQLLGSPLPEVAFLPGFTPIPALSRLRDLREPREVISSPPREGATHGLP